MESFQCKELWHWDPCLTRLRGREEDIPRLNRAQKWNLRISISDRATLTGCVSRQKKFTWRENMEDSLIDRIV